MWSSTKLLILSVFAVSTWGAAGLQAQDCNLRVNGTVTDHHTGEALPFVTVYERVLERGAITDEQGQFIIDQLCATELHLEFSHIGCAAVEVYIDLKTDTIIHVHLHHNAEILGAIEVLGAQRTSGHLGAEVIDRSEIENRSDEDLTAMLTQINGLRAVQNGSALAKPIYHGMSGNRLTILNNGVAQSGQQWGSDHAPEIDSYAADRLTVIQGVNTLAQNGPDIGGMVLIEMLPIAKDPHLHGNLNYSYSSNGRGHVLNGRMEKGGKWAAWRAVLSAKGMGDRQAPTHFLTNTANRQLNAALLLEKELSTKWRSSLYISTFNTEIGILRGSHIGNLNDLNEAFARDIPFFTENSHDYSIDNPKQEVNHHLIKFRNSLQTGFGLMTLTYAGQLNARSEFDIRRGGREDQAALDLTQSDHFTELALHVRPDSALSWRTGIQYRYTRNINDPQTGILPLIPDYLGQTGSAYLIADWNKGQWWAAAGLRTDVKNMYALPISRTLPRVIERKDLWYMSPSVVATLRYAVTEELKLELEYGHRERSPEVNELFSNGLHQGVSGIEEGDDELQNEAGDLLRWSGSYHIQERYFIEASVYRQALQKFIYLVPQNELRATIRGAFPVFKYEQVDTELRGVDLRIAALIGKRLQLRSSYSYLKGKERASGLGLVGIPANSGSVGLHYEIEVWKGLENIHMSLTYAHTTARSDLLRDNEQFPNRADNSPLQGQDFIAPPDAYSLLGFDLDMKKRLGKTSVTFGLRLSNLLDTRYRDYLDRQRYFSDAAGRNVRLRMAWRF